MKRRDLIRRVTGAAAATAVVTVLPLDLVTSEEEVGWMKLLEENPTILNFKKQEVGERYLPDIWTPKGHYYEFEVPLK